MLRSLINRLQLWWLDYKHNKAYRRFMRGYDYAMGRLLKNKNELAEVEHEVEMAVWFGDYDDFDRGIVAAIRILKRLGRV